MIEKLCKMIEKLLQGEYDPLQFSFDFPDAVVKHWDEGINENEKIMLVFDDEIPEICAEYERGKDAKAFLKQIEEEYKRIKK